MNYTLSLTEYSAKYNVSVSTLRRKIRKNSILFTMLEGKYLLPDISYEELKSSNATSSPHKERVISLRKTNTSPAPQQTSLENFDDEGENLEPLKELSLEDFESQLLNQAIEEIKAAYTLALQEKEKQILSLKSHIVDLQTLNKALEDEIERNSIEDHDLEEEFQRTQFLEHEF